MNSCEKYREIISQMLDGELTEPQKTELIAHIADCRECARLYNAFASISLAIEDGLTDPPESLLTNIMDEIHAQRCGSPASRKPARRFGRLLALAACLAVVIFAAEKSDFFSGGTSETLAATRAESVSTDASDGTYVTNTATYDGAGAQNYGTDDGSDEDALITATPFADEECEQVASSGGHDEETAADNSTDRSDASVSSESEAPAVGAEKGEIAINEASVSLMGISAISVYDGQSEEPEPEPIITVTDEMSIVLIMDLLEFSEAGDEIDVSGAPVFIFEVIRGDETSYSLSVWIVEGRLCCVSDADGVLYVAAGDAGDLFAFIADS
ncbi:MAG: hypothetical protein EOM54_07785 [Clostridia bacterium]|nr:hypothetical protein [Clostridia bacterium]NCC68806.1 hypothetical protein [Clostridia bacterium]